MSFDDSNPYQASAIDPKPASKARGEMEYMRAIQYVFESPKWFVNLLWGSLCLLSTSVIPVIGQLIWMGYQFDIVEELHCRPPARGYPDFDLNRLKDYLVRGMWIFLVTLVLMVVFMPIMMIFVFGTMAVTFGVAAAAEGNQEAVGIGAMVMFAVMFVIMMLLSVVMNVVITPLIIRAGLTQDFRASFDFAWLKDFVRVMWIDTLLASIFLMAAGMLFMIVGLLACFVGLYPAMSAVSLVQGHLYLQLYQVYLSRGGHEIPLKPLAPFQPSK